MRAFENDAAPLGNPANTRFLEAAARRAESYTNSIDSLSRLISRQKKYNFEATFAKMDLADLKDFYTRSDGGKRLSDWFFKCKSTSGGYIRPSDGVTADMLKAYHEVARRAILEGNDPISVQINRLEIVERALLELGQ